MTIERTDKCTMQLVLIVGVIAKSLLNQQAINLYIAVIASQEIVIQKEIEKVVEDVMVGVIEDEIGGEIEGETIEVIDKCIARLVLIVESIAKSLLNQVEASQFFVVFVLAKEEVLIDPIDLINQAKNIMR